MKIPRVSVLMSVYNGARYLREAIDSILAQTFADFEFIIVDDGSTDETPAILDSYIDPRIVCWRNETNIGLTKSLNRGLVIARGEYVARQDADDLSLPQRLAREVEFLDSHLQIAVVSTAYTQIDEKGQELHSVVLPLEPDQMREMLFYTHTMCHAAAMGRRVNLQAVGGYDERFVSAQDWDLWLRLAESSQLANLPISLYHVRMHSSSVTGSTRPSQSRAAYQAAAEAMERCLSRPDGWRPSSVTFGRFHFSQALQALVDGQIDHAREHLIQAQERNPQLDDDADYLVRTAIYRAFEVGPAGISRAKSPEDIRAGFDFLNHLFTSLPAGLTSLQAKRRWALGELHAAYAFAAFESGRGRSTRKHCIRAWLSQHTHLKNLGLLSIFVKSLASGN